MWGHADQQEADIVAQLTTPGLGSGPVARRRRLTAAAVLALAFVLLAVLVSRSVSAFAVDVTIHDWLMAHRTATLTTAALAVTATGASSLAVPVVLALALLAGRGTGLGRLLPVVIAAAVLLSGILVRLTVSNVVGRIRPPRGDWAGYAHGYAFPSGHTTTSALTAGVLAGLALERLNGRLRTVVLVAAGVLGHRRRPDPCLPGRPLAHRRRRRLAARARLAVPGGGAPGRCPGTDARRGDGHGVRGGRPMSEVSRRTFLGAVTVTATAVTASACSTDEAPGRTAPHLRRIRSPVVRPFVPGRRVTDRFGDHVCGGLRLRHVRPAARAADHARRRADLPRRRRPGPDHPGVAHRRRALRRPHRDGRRAPGWQTTVTSRRRSSTAATTSATTPGATYRCGG